jgi:hypothetical protein
MSKKFNIHLSGTTGLTFCLSQIYQEKLITEKDLYGFNVVLQDTSENELNINLCSFRSNESKIIGAIFGKNNIISINCVDISFIRFVNSISTQ